MIAENVTDWEMGKVEALGAPVSSIVGGIDRVRMGRVACLSGVLKDTQDTSTENSWIDEIEEIFVPSEHCKQCHDRHYEEWKGMREQTPDLKTFGRVDGALLTWHGSHLTGF